MTQHSPKRVGNRHRDIPIAPIVLNERRHSLARVLEDTIPNELDAIISAEVDMVTVKSSPECLLAICRFLKITDGLDFNYLCSISVVDYEQSKGTFEVIYHLVSLARYHKVAIKVSLPAIEPIVSSVTGIWRAADWFEREGHDLFGIVFDGHPDLSPLLLYDGFDGFPGRKSFPFHDYQEW